MSVAAQPDPFAHSGSVGLRNEDDWSDRNVASAQFEECDIKHVVLVPYCKGPNGGRHVGVDARARQMDKLHANSESFWPSRLLDLQQRIDDVSARLDYSSGDQKTRALDIEFLCLGFSKNSSDLTRSHPIEQTA